VWYKHNRINFLPPIQAQGPGHRLGPCSLFRAPDMVHSAAARKREVESEGSRRQSTGLTKRNRIRGDRAGYKRYKSAGHAHYPGTTR
jgi:hypothetical protein